MLYIAVTRFNEETFKEITTFNKEKNNDCWIYNSPVPLKSNYDKDDNFIVLEMSNNQNKIMGISIVPNIYECQKYNMYSDSNYNRYSYSSNYRIDCSMFTAEEMENVINHLENICFKGKRHLKRGHGIQVLSNKNVNLYLREHDDVTLLTPLQHMFMKRYGKLNHNL
jgi:hypothetical protein